MAHISEATRHSTHWAERSNRSGRTQCTVTRRTGHRTGTGQSQRHHSHRGHDSIPFTYPTMVTMPTAHRPPAPHCQYHLLTSLHSTLLPAGDGALPQPRCVSHLFARRTQLSPSSCSSSPAWVRPLRLRSARSTPRRCPLSPPTPLRSMPSAVCRTPSRTTTAP